MYLLNTLARFDRKRRMYQLTPNAQQDFLIGLYQLDLDNMK